MNAFAKGRIPRMQITQALPLANGMTLCLVGAGGKTSLIFALAGELAARGQAILVTTTTAMFHPDHDSRQDHPPCAQPYDPPLHQPSGQKYDKLILGSTQSLCKKTAKAGQVVVAAQSHDPANDKLKGYSPCDLTRVAENHIFDYILIEADGSKRLPVKAPALHEPVIPVWTDMVIGCMGLDCLGRPLDDQTVHRPKFFSAVTKQAPGKPIGPDHLVSLAASPLGLFKNTSKEMQKIVLLNKADTRELVQEAGLWPTGFSGNAPGWTTAWWLVCGTQKIRFVKIN